MVKIMVKRFFNHNIFKITYQAWYCNKNPWRKTNLIWPAQPQPNDKTRKLWKQAIKLAFPREANSQLITPLGRWTDITSRRLWIWFFHPFTSVKSNISGYFITD